jgi:hypothetical protein
MFRLSLRSANHTRHYSIMPAQPSGWEVRFEEDKELRRHDRYQDWHRVERARALFEQEASELQANGWLVLADASR